MPQLLNNGFIFILLTNISYKVVNRKAFLIAFGSIVGYYIFGVSAYLLLYKAYGYSTWDSTVIHHVEVRLFDLDRVLWTKTDLPLQVFHWYFLFSTAPATLFIYIITRIYHISYSTFVPSVRYKRDPIIFSNLNAENESTGRIPLL